MELVHEILSNDESSRSNAVRSIEVDKLVELEYFPEELLIQHTNELNYKELHTSQEDYVMTSVRDCVQFMFNKLCIFPKEIKDGIAFSKCSGSTFCLPREKPVPTSKPLTKWQKFAKEKGIKKTKKPRVTWDDILQKWVPTYGHKKAAAEKEKDWLIEVPKNVDPSTDMFAEKKKIKKENIAKNEYQRLRNIAAGKKIRVPEFGIPPMEGNMHRPQLEVAAAVAKSSTASLGKFQPNLPGEKEASRPKKLSKKRPKSLKNVDEERNDVQVINRQLQKERTHNKNRQKLVSKNESGTNKKPKRKANKLSSKKTKSVKEKGFKKRGNSGRKRR